VLTHDLDMLVGAVALEVGDFLGTLVDEQHDDLDVGVVLGDRLGHLLHQHGLARAGRGDDQHALALADRGHQVDDAALDLVGRGLEDETLLGVQRRQVLEVDVRSWMALPGAPLTVSTRSSAK
jgi:hypothetical protein